MKVGTKSLLFGGHQFILHPTLVWIAWVSHYHQIPNIKEAICILMHDWGYFGKSDIDGEEGEEHPDWAALWALYHLDSKYERRYYELCAGHSRFFAKKYRFPISKLCIVDKLGIGYYHPWVWFILCKMSGELQEYQNCEKYSVVERSLKKNPREWFVKYRAAIRQWAKDGDMNKTIEII